MVFILALTSQEMHIWINLKHLAKTDLLLFQNGGIHRQRLQNNYAKQVLLLDYKDRERIFKTG